MPFRIFEHLVAECLASGGWADVRLVGQNPETSADVFAARTAESAPIYFEVKRRRDQVGIEVVQQVFGAMLMERPRFGWKYGVVVALNGFAHFRNYDQKDLKRLGIKLRDRSDLRRWLEDYEPQGTDMLYLPKPITRLPGADENHDA